MLRVWAGGIVSGSVWFMWGMVALIGRVAFLLGLGAGLGLVVNTVRPDGVRFRSVAAAPTSCSANAGATALVSDIPAVEVLPPMEAVRLCGDPQTLVADVRDSDAFAQGHVSGAIHLPCAASGSVAAAAVDLLGDRRTLMVYGNGTDDAKLVADEMRSRVARADVRVLVLAGGFAAWDQAGLACSSGPCPDCRASPMDHK
ncbi:MAG: rhodanese-like domain-containing protein [Deltaproteobacteria bacterium]|nr:rhodanese-like domain-containing protein [Deltaproteobacteria bacterium]